ncbi:hypothetical protein FHR38_002496 [Micromonospora polyrhachis]|uniref:Uncharacterized protein n=1 Tax=Micromonospora polyrhachis TaxID=1282883 RepID=A0A7W7SPW0_9ACTN|nr:hypothetical protein [Micromonospora polyrhachis]
MRPDTDAAAPGRPPGTPRPGDRRNPLRWAREASVLPCRPGAAMGLTDQADPVRRPAASGRTVWPGSADRRAGPGNADRRVRPGNAGRRAEPDLQWLLAADSGAGVAPGKPAAGRVPGCRTAVSVGEPGTPPVALGARNPGTGAAVHRGAKVQPADGVHRAAGVLPAAPPRRMVLVPAASRPAAGLSGARPGAWPVPGTGLTTILSAVAVAVGPTATGSPAAGCRLPRPGGPSPRGRVGRCRQARGRVSRRQPGRCRSGWCRSISPTGNPVRRTEPLLLRECQSVGGRWMSGDL